MKCIQWILVLVAICATASVIAQTSELPVFYGQYFNDPQVNSIQLNNNRQGYFLLGHRRNGQKISGVNTSLFSARWKLEGDKAAGFHSLGLQVVADKEGFLINRTRIGATYARHLKLTNDFNLAGGIVAGLYNHSIKANEVTGGYSSNAFDASFSLKVYSDRTEVGLSVSQAPNATIVPVSSEILLQRNLNLLVRHRLALAEQFELIPFVYARGSGKNENYYSGFSAAAGLQLLVANRIMAGFGTETRNGSYLYLGIEQVQLGSSILGLDFSYYIPNRNVFGTNIQRIELMVTYGIESQK